MAFYYIPPGSSPGLTGFGQLQVTKPGFKPQAFLPQLSSCPPNMVPDPRIGGNCVCAPGLVFNPEGGCMKPPPPPEEPPLPPEGPPPS